MIPKKVKAKNHLIYGLDRSIYNNVDLTSSVHKTWRMLEVRYQDTNSIKETKINILVQLY